MYKKKIWFGTARGESRDLTHLLVQAFYYRIALEMSRFLLNLGHRSRTSTRDRCDRNHWPREATGLGVDADINDLIEEPQNEVTISRSFVTTATPAEIKEVQEVANFVEKRRSIQLWLNLMTFTESLQENCKKSSLDRFLEKQPAKNDVRECDSEKKREPETEIRKKLTKIQQQISFLNTLTFHWFYFLIF